jgi:hypothetical protein
MKKQLTVRIPDVDGEEGLSQACRNGNLFRNDAQLVDLYKEGFRIYNYSIVEDAKTKNPSKLQTLVKVFLKK